MQHLHISYTYSVNRKASHSACVHSPTTTPSPPPLSCHHTGTLPHWPVWVPQVWWSTDQTHTHTHTHTHTVCTGSVSVATPNTTLICSSEVLASHFYTCRPWPKVHVQPRYHPIIPPPLSLPSPPPQCVQCVDTVCMHVWGGIW